MTYYIKTDLLPTALTMIPIPTASTWFILAAQTDVSTRCIYYCQNGLTYPPFFFSVHQRHGLSTVWFIDLLVLSLLISMTSTGCGSLLFFLSCHSWSPWPPRVVGICSSSCLVTLDLHGLHGLWVFDLLLVLSLLICMTSTGCGSLLFLLSCHSWSPWPPRVAGLCSSSCLVTLDLHDLHGLWVFALLLFLSLLTSMTSTDCGSLLFCLNSHPWSPWPPRVVGLWSSACLVTLDLHDLHGLWVFALLLVVSLLISMTSTGCGSLIFCLSCHSWSPWPPRVVGLWSSSCLVTLDLHDLHGLWVFALLLVLSLLISMTSTGCGSLLFFLSCHSWSPWPPRIMGLCSCACLVTLDLHDLHGLWVFDLLLVLSLLISMTSTGCGSLLFFLSSHSWSPWPPRIVGLWSSSCLVTLGLHDLHGLWVFALLLVHPSQSRSVDWWYCKHRDLYQLTNLTWCFLIKLIWFKLIWTHMMGQMMSLATAGGDVIIGI